MIASEQELYLLADTEEAKDMNAHILDLLRSKENENTLLAFQLIEGGGLSKDVENYLRYHVSGNVAYCLFKGLPIKDIDWWCSSDDDWLNSRFTFTNFITGVINAYEFYLYPKNKLIFNLRFLVCSSKKKNCFYRITCGKNSHTEFKSVADFIDSLSKVVKHSMKFDINILFYKHHKIYAKNLCDKINEMHKPTNCTIKCNITQK